MIKIMLPRDTQMTNKYTLVGKNHQLSKHIINTPIISPTRDITNILMNKACFITVRVIQCSEKKDQMLFGVCLELKSFGSRIVANSNLCWIDFGFY